MTNETKNVPELRFPEFEGEWEEKKLGEVSNVTMGQSPKSSNYTDNPRDMILVQGSADIDKGKIRPRIYTKEITKKVEINDILLSVRAPVGEIAIAQFEACIGRGMCAITGNLFLYYFLDFFKIRKKWNYFSQGSTFESVSGKEINKLKLSITNKEEQQKIGDFFSKLDRQIELEEQKLALLEEQKKGYMQKIFSQELRFKDENNNSYPEWKIKKLEEISEFQNGKAHENFVSDTGKFILVNSKFISTESKVKKYVDKQLTPLGINDIAIVMSDVPNGKALAKCYLIENDNTFTLNQRIGRIFNIEGNSRFLFTQINRNKQLLKYDSGVGQTNLKKSEIIGIKIYCPNKREQDKIGDFFINLDSIIEKQSTKVELLKQRKKGLLQKMFI